MSTSETLKVLVLLSTGKQGTAVVSQLSTILGENGHPLFEVLAVTRNPQSDAARPLASLANVRVLKGSTSDEKATGALFAEAGSLDGLVMIQLDADEHPGGFQGEIEEGKRIIDTALKHGVKHIVYHGMDLPTILPDPIVHDYVKPKVVIPDYLSLRSEDGKAYTWTWLRPPNFFENFIIPGQAAFMITLLTLVENLPMQFISINDIAFFSAQSLASPSLYHGKALRLAGDLVTRDIFVKEWKALGLPDHLLHDVSEDKVKAAIAGAPLEGLVEFLHDNPLEFVNVEELRQIRPELATLSSFLEANKEHLLSDST